MGIIFSMSVSSFVLQKKLPTFSLSLVTNRELNQSNQNFEHYETNSLYESKQSDTLRVHRFGLV